LVTIAQPLFSLLKILFYYYYYVYKM